VELPTVLKREWPTSSPQQSGGAASADPNFSFPPKKLKQTFLHFLFLLIREFYILLSFFSTWMELKAINPKAPEAAGPSSFALYLDSLLSWKKIIKKNKKEKNREIEKDVAGRIGVERGNLLDPYKRDTRRTKKRIIAKI
jgi:hypothetical protein